MSDADIDFEEGEEYDLDEVLQVESEMNKSGSWELVDDLTLGGEVDGKVITLEYSKVECVDVTPISELTELD